MDASLDGQGGVHAERTALMSRNVGVWRERRQVLPWVVSGPAGSSGSVGPAFSLRGPAAQFRKISEFGKDCSSRPLLTWSVATTTGTHLVSDQVRVRHPLQVPTPVRRPSTTSRTPKPPPHLSLIHI